MRHSGIILSIVALFPSWQADADPLNCVKDPIPVYGPGAFSVVFPYSFNVPASGGIIYREVTNCYSVNFIMKATRTWCRVGQDADPNRYSCGPGVPAGCDVIDSFLVFAVTYTVQPDQTHRVCVTVRNSQPANPRYFDFYIEETDVKPP